MIKTKTNKKELGEDAIEALKHYRKYPRSIQWIALDSFRIWYNKTYELDDGNMSMELSSVEFRVKEGR